MAIKVRKNGTDESFDLTYSSTTGACTVTPGTEANRSFAAGDVLTFVCTTYSATLGLNPKVTLTGSLV